MQKTCLHVYSMHKIFIRNSFCVTGLNDDQICNYPILNDFADGVNKNWNATLTGAKVCNTSYEKKIMFWRWWQRLKQSSKKTCEISIFHIWKMKGFSRMSIYQMSPYDDSSRAYTASAKYLKNRFLCTWNGQLIKRHNFFCEIIIVVKFSW